MEKNNDSVDWSVYPPDRVEGMKLFHKGPSSDEDGPPTEEELKMMCLKWVCRVNMKVDNFLYWSMKKIKEKNFNNDDERFQRAMPRIFAAVEKKGLYVYERYQEDYAEKNRKYLERCAEWRRIQVRNIRFLDKLHAQTARWQVSDESESSSDDSESLGANGNLGDSLDNRSRLDNCESLGDRESDDFNWSRSSVETVRFNSYPETESVPTNLDSSITDFIIKEEENIETLDEVNTQMFVPETTSTQK